MPFAIVTTLVVLLALEAASRLIRRVDYPPEPLITEGNLAWKENRCYDPLLFWRMRPNRQGKFGTTNSLGLRGPEVGAKTAREFRVLSLGESTTY